MLLPIRVLYFSLFSPTPFLPLSLPHLLPLAGISLLLLPLPLLCISLSLTLKLPLNNTGLFFPVSTSGGAYQRFKGRLSFLQNNYYPYGNIALVGTKGYTFEGPFYLDRRGRIAGWDGEAEAKAEKLVERELARLRQSFEAAAADGYSRFIMFLHYPPTSILEHNSGFTRMAEEYGAEQVIYAHCHGESRFHDSILGGHHGIRYSLVSGDYLRWVPMKVMD